MGIITDIENANKKPPKPKSKVIDALFNELKENDVVSFVANGQLFGRVVAVEEGGIHTPQGVTQSRCRIIIDLQLSTQPGSPLFQVAKVANPVNDALVGKIAENLPSS